MYVYMLVSRGSKTRQPSILASRLSTVRTKAMDALATRQMLTRAWGTYDDWSNLDPELSPTCSGVE